MTIELPKYPITSIPSGGIAYPNNWEILIEPYRFEVSSTVAYTSLTSKRFYNQITEGVHTNFPKKLLTLEDVLFLGVARKLISIESDKVTLQATCPECLEKVNPTLSIRDAIKFTACKIKNRDKYPVKAVFKNAKYVAWFKVLSVDDYLQLMAKESITPAERLAKSTYRLEQIIEDPETGETSQKLLHLLEEADTFKDPNAKAPVKMKYEDIAKIYETFVGMDADILEKLLEIFEPSDLEPIEVKCTNPNCGHTFMRQLTQEELTRVLHPFRPETVGVPEDFIDL